MSDADARKTTDTTDMTDMTDTTDTTNLGASTDLIDPHQILGTGPGAAPGEVLAAVGRAMRERQHPIHAIAAAQRELLDPARRAVHDFVQSVDLAPLLAELPELPELPKVGPPEPGGGHPTPPALVCLDRGPDSGTGSGTNAHTGAGAHG